MDNAGTSGDDKQRCDAASALDRLTQSPKLRRIPIQAASAALAKAGKTLQRLNLAKLIDDMEHDQELADRLEIINKENKCEESCKNMVREAVERCRQEIESHLDEFLTNHQHDENHPRYEDWIQVLHPENVAPGMLLPEMGLDVDGRFYVEESDHLILWNQKAPADKKIKPLGRHGQADIPLDLLDQERNLEGDEFHRSITTSNQSLPQMCCQVDLLEM